MLSLRIIQVSQNIRRWQLTYKIQDHISAKWELMLWTLWNKQGNWAELRWGNLKQKSNPAFTTLSCSSKTSESTLKSWLVIDSTKLLPNSVRHRDRPTYASPWTFNWYWKHNSKWSFVALWNLWMVTPWACNTGNWRHSTLKRLPNDCSIQE